MEEFVDEPLRVKANGHTITCSHVVIATHTPLMGKTGLVSALALQTKLYLYTSYVVGGRLSEGDRARGVCSGTPPIPTTTCASTRQRDFDYAIFGGEDHKTGQEEDTEALLSRARSSCAKALIPGIDITHRWSGQVVETNDGLPFIGETSPRQFARPATPATA